MRLRELLVKLHRPRSADTDSSAAGKDRASARAAARRQFSLMVSPRTLSLSSPEAVHYLIGRVAILMPSTAAFSYIATSSSSSSSAVYM